MSRPARGAWVEIATTLPTAATEGGRAPQGARGLKLLRHAEPEDAGRSRPARGAWVEIAAPATHAEFELSRPARGAWVEIHFMRMMIPNGSVAPRKGRVG